MCVVVGGIQAFGDDGKRVSSHCVRAVFWYSGYLLFISFLTTVVLKHSRISDISSEVLGLIVTETVSCWPVNIASINVNLSMMKLAQLCA